MILKYDCKHFQGDRPCDFHKTEGVKCDNCPHYDVVKTKILIIKLDAIGDVLRTTSILHGLKEKYPGSEILWVTRSSAVQLFFHNTLVDKVLAYENPETQFHLNVQQFDLVINLDAAQASAVLASFVTGKEKLGFGLNERGKVFPFNNEAIPWFEMGAFDDVKKRNTRTYQDIMLDICRLKTENKEIIVNLSEKELAFAAAFALQHSLKKDSVIVGMNTGASPRWQYKQWTMEGYEKLITRILNETAYTVLLYGGHHEGDRNSRLAKLHPTRVIDTGTENTLRQFFSLITLSDVFLTGDTLAMHAATALKKKVIALFGPTSVAEIETYNNRITKLHSDLDCLCCYKMTCDFEPNCMNSLTPDYLFTALQSAISSIKKVSSPGRQ